jgi:hypothetical protein
MKKIPYFVIPVKAGIHFALRAKIKMDSGFRRNDGQKIPFRTR